MSFKAPVVGGWSPWGTIDRVDQLARGAWAVNTPCHGGIRLSPHKNSRVHWVWRRWGGWYEEDSDWCIPYASFPGDVGGAEDTKRAIDAVLGGHTFAAFLALGQWLDGRRCVKRDLRPGDLVTWTAKVNVDHVPVGNPMRVYSMFDERGEEQFVDRHHVPTWPLGPIACMVIGEPTWSKKHHELCYHVLHPNGRALVSRSYLERA